MVEIELANRQSQHAIDSQRLVAAARLILQEEGIRRGTLSIAVVDDPTIHDLNRQYLQHDYPTDVLSFVLEQRAGFLEGEVVVSADTAATRCEAYGWSLDDELLLYVVHGTLHLAGYDDGTPPERQAMRQREEHYLARFGLDARYDDSGEELSGKGDSSEDDSDAGISGAAADGPTALQGPGQSASGREGDVPQEPGCGDRGLGSEEASS